MRKLYRTRVSVSGPRSGGKPVHAAAGPVGQGHDTYAGRGHQEQLRVETGQNAVVLHREQATQIGTEER